jgi:hypothetical protein
MHAISMHNIDIETQQESGKHYLGSASALMRISAQVAPSGTSTKRLTSCPG